MKTTLTSHTRAHAQPPRRNRKNILASSFINLLKLLKLLNNLNINPNMKFKNFYPQNPALRQKKLQVPQISITFAASK